jgi:basic amino acid/polyamine antiporter, APA family
VPGHPFTTGLFVLAAAGIVASTFYSYPQNSVIGLGILAAGIPVYLYWSRRTS